MIAIHSHSDMLSKWEKRERVIHDTSKLSVFVYMFV